MHSVQQTSNNNNIPLNDDDESDIFNDVLGDGGGVDPSIDESIRESIKCSFVSSECEITKQMESTDFTRDAYVMNRMNWITYLKVLFDQLESFNQNKQKHVENSNFIKALKKIKNLLPLQSRNDYYKGCSDVAFSYKEVEQGMVNMPKYITWDNVIDVFLSKHFSQVSNMKTSQAFKQIGGNEGQYQEPEQINESISDVDFKDESGADSFYRKGLGKLQPMQSVAPNTQSQKNKQSIYDVYSLSFADSVMKINTPQYNGSHLENNIQEQLMVQGPLLRDKDEDEACEIDSDFDNDEENKSNSRRHKSKLEESVRSSRTATFKSVRNANIHNSHNVNQTNSSIGNNTQNTTQQAQDSYYAIQSNQKKPLAYQPSSQVSQQQQQQQAYYQQQQHQIIVTTKNNDSYILDQEDGQVELGSNNHSRGSSRYRNNEKISTYEENNHIEKSTRISSFNSYNKNNNPNSTILSQNSNQSSQSNQKVNSSKISVQSSSQQSTSGIMQSNIVDLDLQGKGLTNFEMDFKTTHGDKKTLRSINVSLNSVAKLPQNLEKSMQYMNISFNKLKSLYGIENCINLKFLNVQGNQIASAQPIVILQSLRELIFSNNQLSILKEISQLKNLNLLDLSYNKIVDLEKIIPLQNLKKLKTLSLTGNQIHKHQTYEITVKKMLGWVDALDPDQIKDFTQFPQMENICFTEAPLMIIETMSTVNLVNKEVMSDQKLKERSKTPNRERNKSQLGTSSLVDSKLKSNLISPHRNTVEYQVTGSKISNSSNKSKEPPLKTSKLQAQFSQQVKTYGNQYYENKLRLQGKAQIVPQNSKGSVTSRLNNKERSVTPEQKSVKIDDMQPRDRSTSNISRNEKIKQYSSQNSEKPLKIIDKQTKASPPQMNFQQKTKESAAVKKVSLNVNAAAAYNSQGRVTPQRSNIQTPRQQKIAHCYKRSFCQTEEEHSLLNDTPSEKNTVRTAPTQESSNKKPIKKISRKDEINIQFSPGQKSGIYQTMGAMPQSSRNNMQRPATTLKQRANTSQKEETKEYKLINQTAQPPQSTKNQNFSQSFAFDGGRQTPSQQSQYQPSRPSSQLQKFITASKPSAKQQAQIPTVLQPCQKLTNLPPRAYQSRIEMPGDKKTKADMSSSIISQSAINQSSSIKGCRSILQTGGTNDDDSRTCEEVSSRSMSPVCDESNNIKKLKVDLTQYMNKQQ